jgi:hypothetical protein
MASGLSVRCIDGMEDHRNPRQATKHAWIKLIVKIWVYRQAKSAVGIDELEWRDEQCGDTRWRLIQGTVCAGSCYTALRRPRL